MDIVQNLGMRALNEKVLAQREVGVLSRIAGGKTNLEIADELVIAQGPARWHVANIYEKIGPTNRVEVGL